VVVVSHQFITVTTNICVVVVAPKHFMIYKAWLTNGAMGDNEKSLDLHCLCVLHNTTIRC